MGTVKDSHVESSLDLRAQIDPMIEYSSAQKVHFLFFSVFQKSREVNAVYVAGWQKPSPKEGAAHNHYRRASYPVCF